MKCVLVLCIALASGMQAACDTQKHSVEPRSLLPESSEAEKRMHEAVIHAPLYGFGRTVCVLSPGAVYLDRNREFLVQHRLPIARPYVLIEDLGSLYKVAGYNLRKSAVWDPMVVLEPDVILLYVEKEGAEEVPLDDPRCI